MSSELVSLLRQFPQSYKTRKVAIGDYDPATNQVKVFHDVGRSGVDDLGQPVLITGFTPIPACAPGTSLPQYNVVAFNIDYDAHEQNPEFCELSGPALNGAIERLVEILKTYLDRAPRDDSPGAVASDSVRSPCRGGFDMALHLSGVNISSIRQLTPAGSARWAAERARILAASDAEIKALQGRGISFHLDGDNQPVVVVQELESDYETVTVVNTPHQGFLQIKMLFVEHPVFHAFREAGWLMSAI